MLEGIFEGIAGTFLEGPFRKLFVAIFKFIQGIGLRVYSLFTGDIDLPISELRQKYDDSIWPWMIVAGLLGVFF